MTTPAPRAPDDTTCSPMMIAHAALGGAPAGCPLRLRTPGDVRAWTAHPTVIRVDEPELGVWLTDTRLTMDERNAFAAAVLLAGKDAFRFLLTLTELIHEGQFTPTPALYRALAVTYIRLTVLNGVVPAGGGVPYGQHRSMVELCTATTQYYRAAMTDSGTSTAPVSSVFDPIVVCATDLAMAWILPPAIFEDAALIGQHALGWSDAFLFSVTPEMVAITKRLHAEAGPNGARWRVMRGALRDAGEATTSWLMAGAAAPHITRGQRHVPPVDLPLASVSADTPWDFVRRAPDTVEAPWLLPAPLRHWETVAPHVSGRRPIGHRNLLAYVNADEAWDMLRRVAERYDDALLLSLEHACTYFRVLSPITARHAEQLPWLTEHLRHARTAKRAGILARLVSRLTTHLPNPPIAIGVALLDAAARWPSLKPDPEVLLSLPCTPATARIWWTYAAEVCRDGHDAIFAFAILQASLASPDGVIPLPTGDGFTALLEGLPLRARSQVAAHLVGQRGPTALLARAPRPEVRPAEAGPAAPPPIRDLPRRRR